MDMVVTFPGGKKVDASYKGFQIRTDQPEKSGGQGSAPSPFDLFLTSIGTCVGIYVLSFCQERNISTENTRIILKTEMNSETRRVEKVIIDVNLTESFPEKYKKAVKLAADQCAVKKHILHAPDFDINVNID
jgi:ribosomal protein S12 methylthiotransferase accessory factor